MLTHILKNNTPNQRSRSQPHSLQLLPIKTRRVRRVKRGEDGETEEGTPKDYLWQHLVDGADRLHGFLALVLRKPKILAERHGLVGGKWRYRVYPGYPESDILSRFAYVLSQKLSWRVFFSEPALILIFWSDGLKPLGSIASTSQPLWILFQMHRICPRFNSEFLFILHITISRFFLNSWEVPKS